MLPNKERLTKKKEIKATLKKKQYSFKSPLLRFVARDNTFENSRVAVVAPKALGNAVKRNRLRRIFKAAFSQAKLRRNVDVVLFPSPGALDKSAKEIQAELERFIKYG